jgi:hypothetical protein
VTAGKTTDALAVESLVESGVCFADPLIENVAEGGHGTSDKLRRDGQSSYEVPERLKPLSF